MTVSENAYAKSGVDVEAGYEVVSRIKKHVAKTERLGQLFLHQSALLLLASNLRPLQPQLAPIFQELN